MRFKLLTAVALSAFISLTPVLSTAEVVPGTTLSINFESANVVGTGRNINMTRIPVTDIDTGNTTFYDASFKFTFSTGSGFTFEQIQSVAITPPVSEATNIVPGLYITQPGNCYLVEGPTLLNANRSLYTIRGVNSSTSASCTNSTDRYTAQIVSGAATSHPDIGNREIVPNLSDTYVYGFISSSGGFCGQPINCTWDANELLGVRQSGNQLILGLFSEGVDNNGKITDFKDPRETAILTKVIE